MITAEKRTQWLRHVERWKECGLSVNKYCIENGINKSSFRYWIERDKKKNAKSGKFISLLFQNLYREKRYVPLF
jgi:hypothetical protein